MKKLLLAGLVVLNFLLAVPVLADESNNDEDKMTRTVQHSW